MIPQILDKIEDNSVMYLINAIAFDAKWQSPYEKEDVESGTFTSENGTQQTVDMMYSTEAYYLEDDSTTGFIRPYEDGYSFVALLPKEGISMEDYIGQLSAEKLISLVGNASTDYDVDAAIPKFKSEYSIELKDTLQNMGMTDAFDESRQIFEELEPVIMEISILTWYCTKPISKLMSKEQKRELQQLSEWRKRCPYMNLK